MTIDQPILIAISALLVAVTTAVWTRRTKGLELVSVKKAEAHCTLLQKAGLLAHAADTNEHYSDYLMALNTARLVALPKVEGALSDDQGVNSAIQTLRSGDPKDYHRREKIWAKALHSAMERLIKSMNADLMSLF